MTPSDLPEPSSYPQIDRREVQLLVYAALAANVTPDVCAEAARQLREGTDWPYSSDVIAAAVYDLEQRERAGRLAAQVREERSS